MTSTDKDAPIDKDWILPAAIPFQLLKGKDLEECLYWLFDAMGAKDLEWRTGGTGGGAADGGRDLEAHFYQPTIDDELEPKVWWIECKGRTGTVEKSEVQEACINSAARNDLDYLVIATNTQFSNPTRDWVKEWQKSHMRPKVRLWDSENLERLLSRHPDVVLRLFSEALSVRGQVQALETRFWNRLEYTSAGSLERIWDARSTVDMSGAGAFALVVNEFSHGDITMRPWGAVFGTESLIEVLHLGLLNVGFLAIRCIKTGADQVPIWQALSYLILCALKNLPSKNIATLVEDSLFRGEASKMPPEAKELFLSPIMDQLLSELQDVCSEDCERMSARRSAGLTQSKDEIETYWSRFEKEGSTPKQADNRRLLLERLDAPCVVGFAVDKDNGCPLFAAEPKPDNIVDVLDVVKRVSAFRRAEARESSS